MLLGWNPDSLLQAELSPGLEMISLFEPIYPELKQIKEIHNSNRERNLCNLNSMLWFTRLLDQSRDRKYTSKNLHAITS